MRRAKQRYMYYIIGKKLDYITAEQGILETERNLTFKKTFKLKLAFFLL
jgi:hypothetical protein